MYTIFLYLVARSTPIRRGDILILVRVPKWPNINCIEKSQYMMRQCDLFIARGHRTKIKISPRLIGVERATRYRKIVYIDVLEVVLLFSKF